MTPYNKELDTSDLTKNQQLSAAWKKNSYPKVHKEMKEYCHILMTNESKARLLVMLGTQHNDIIRHSHHEQFILEKCMNVKIYYLALTLTLHS
jgi:hypothetical protein